MTVLAYHITWGTYGTRLHGDPRGTVDRKHNEFGTPVLGFDEHRWEREKENLKFPPVVLTRDQMRSIESLVPEICERGHWKYITCAAGPDHVHVILKSEHSPETIRRLMKRWLGQKLMQRYKNEPGCPQPGKPGTGATWWAECGSIRWIDSERYLHNATKYVYDQRAIVNC
jgi:REP element-mobilizing transposase RayT